MRPGSRGRPFERNWARQRRTRYPGSPDTARVLLAGEASPEIVTAQASESDKPGTLAWTGTLNDYVTGSKVVINTVSPPPPPGGSDARDFSAVLLPANFSDAPVVTVGQAYSLTLADAVARNSLATASDLIYQSLLRTDTVSTSAITLNSMVTSVGCYPPLTDALKGAINQAAAQNASIILSLALRNVQAPIGNLAACVSSLESEASAPAPSP
ncbi:hypothetical protein APUTEX25_000470 [Auxenochlorella protothecoides]|uniref:Uncharacterized protein n=1 Tax=Auxenochlorella protothecoides TaxID=3075 RepID=A0A3M7KWQ2_AUXPR|nr:hypothetical protein APUTEX25_000470 [Auxenochlorella protothecoides]|eukprot:RMZ54953.1 hypothetical protein APUTEX25_000470 [Auxenochlorella protothecoides]